MKSRLPNDLPRFGDRLLWAIESNPRFGSQAKYADAIGKSTSYVAQLVGRDLPPGKKALPELSETLGVPEVWLAYGVANGEATAVREARPSYAGWDPSRILEILDRESRSAELRAANAETHADAAKIAEEAAKERALAAKEWAVAARLAEENARDLRWGLFTADPEATEIAEQGEAALASVEEEEEEKRQGTSTRGQRKRPPRRQPRAKPQNGGS